MKKRFGRGGSGQSFALLLLHSAKDKPLLRKTQNVFASQLSFESHFSGVMRNVG